MLGAMTVTSKPISDRGVEPRRREEVRWLTEKDQSNGRLLLDFLTVPRFSRLTSALPRQYCAVGQIRCMTCHVASRMSLLQAAECFFEFAAGEEMVAVGVDAFAAEAHRCGLGGEVGDA